MNQKEVRKFGRRPKHDDFDDLDPESNNFTGKPVNENFETEDSEGQDEESEEINLDNPDFKKGELWNDYADDMDFEE